MGGADEWLSQWAVSLIELTPLSGSFGSILKETESSWKLAGSTRVTFQGEA